MKLQKKNFRVYLRALEPEDHLLTHKWRSDEAYLQGVVSINRFVSLDTEKRWIETVIKKHESLKELRLGIVLKENNKLIGLHYLTGINLINKNAFEHYLLGDEEHRGKGYVSESRHLILEYAFNEIGLNKVTAHILSSNEPSIKSIEKFGYTYEGTSREEVFKNGKFNDLNCYSILKKEFDEE